MTRIDNHQGKCEVGTNVQTNKPLADLLTNSLRQTERSLGPVLQRITEWSVDFAPYARAFVAWSHTVDALNDVGWLPYRSLPFQFVEECGGDLTLLDSRLSDYYRTGWPDIRAEMEYRLANHHIDDEARRTFCEAILSHEAKYFRCVCRVLFPEIERMIGAGRVGSKEMLRTMTGKRDLAVFAFGEVFDYVLFGRLVDHVYKNVNESNLERFERNHVPNRHAAMHGLVPYSSHKSSMNMLILTDYVFGVLSPLVDSE